ncbi:two-component system response regulator [Endothiovibrio diazotrophicus]
MKVLFVDDMATVRMLYGRLLQTHGYQVLLAASMGEALEIALAERPRLAIIDYHMPDGNGADLCRELLAHPETADLLAVMHSQSRDVVQDSLEAGAIDLIYKDDPKEVFLMRVAAMARFVESQEAQRAAEEESRSRELENVQRLRELEERAREELEGKVRERTRELSEANQRLRQEMVERCRAEQDLRLAHKVVENTSEAIILTDPTGTIIDINPAFTKITGFNREEAIGSNPRQFKSGRHDDDFYAAMWQRIADTGAWRGEVWDRRKNGEVYPKRLTINAVYNRAGNVEHYIGIFTDITEAKNAEERLERLAYYDPLTGLPNRMLFRDRLEHEFAAARRHDKRLALFFIDLDRFKHVNDTLGHSAGDELLQGVAERLRRCVRSADTVARMGGDEFTVIVTDVVEEEDAARVARDLLDELHIPTTIRGHDIIVGASIGIALYPDNGEDFETLTKNADLAMYRAKERGKGIASFYQEEMNDRTSERLAMEAKLLQAIKEDDLVLHYQPKLDLESGRVTGMEALVRWPQPDGSVIPPFEFIPVAEETGLILPLGRWVMERAARDCLEWNRQGHDLKVAVNISAREFQDSRLLDRIDEVLADTGLAPKHFEVEITESMVMRDVDSAIRVMQALRERGVSISIDDFGTGYSSLSYLKQFPLHSLKIDRSFVRDLAADSNDRAIVSAVLSVAKAMELRVVAEGVEDNDQLTFLDDKGCDELQGFLVSKPLDKIRFEELLAKGESLGAALLRPRKGRP